MSLNILENLREMIKKSHERDVIKFVNKKPFNLPPDSKVLDAIEIFLVNSINVIAITKNKNLVGIISKRNLLDEINGEESNLLEERKIGEIMHKKFLSLGENENLRDICENLLSSGEECVAIIKKNGEFIGLIDYLDILNNFLNQNFEIENPPLNKEGMEKKINFVKSETRLSEFLSQTLKKNEEYAIVTEKNKPIGIITFTDILSQIYKGTDLTNINVNHVMSPRLTTVQSWEKITSVMNLFMEKRFNQIPLREKNKIVGVLKIKGAVRTYFEFLKILENEKGNFLVKPVEFNY